MLIELRIKNCYAFENNIVYSMNADMRTKRFENNVHNINNLHVLKTSAIYGPNNVGKSCLVNCIKSFKQIVLNNKNAELMRNYLTTNKYSELGITFINEANKYSYDFKVDFESKKFIYEKFSKIIKDDYGKEKEECWFIIDRENNIYKSLDKALTKTMNILSDNNILIYLVDTTKFSKLNECKNILINFANKIDIINMNNIPLSHTINLMKNKSKLQERVVDFIKSADIYLDNFEYVNDEEISPLVKLRDGKALEKALDNDNYLDQIKLVSTYKGIKLPSIIFDSTGTKKIAALASYIIEALDNGRILVIDEIDSSIHFKLSRAIVAMFNNELNDKAQLIFTSHDISLIDCKHLFRKEQIWFIHKDETGIYSYSLADYTARMGIRDTTDIIDKYKKGILGAIPEPDLIKCFNK